MNRWMFTAAVAMLAGSVVWGAGGGTRGGAGGGATSQPANSWFGGNTDDTGTGPARPPIGNRGGTSTKPTAQGLKKYDTPYYILYTDVSEPEARETDLRMTRMFEEYQRRTKDFAVGQIKEKFPFYLFRSERDYNAAGGPPNSAGVYIESRDGGKRLMAIAGKRVDDNTWSVVQHEGFHQFIAATIKYDLPIWVNEGLAEYMGEAQWTGDGFVSGLIRQQRLEDIRKGIRRGFKPFAQFLAITDKEWSADLTAENYDQAWSMVHFLANADGGKYQGPFLKFMTEVSKGIDGEKAWVDVFGKDTAAFQQRYAAWWLGLPDEPTMGGFIKVMVQTETSFLARATIMRQSFPDADTFFTRYQPPAFGVNRDLWLPPELFALYSDIAPGVGKWTIESGNATRLILQMRDGTTYVGSFSAANGKVTRVGVDIGMTK